MKIGVELRHISVGASGGIALYLQDLLETLFRRFPEDHFTVFCTVFNRGLVRGDFPNARFSVLPLFRFFPEVDRIAREDGIDVLLRGFPVEDDLSFPMGRQVVIVPDLQHDFLPELFEKEVLRSRRAAFHRCLSEAGALVTISEHAQRTILEHPWNRCRHVTVATPALRPGFAVRTSAGPGQDAASAAGRDEYFLFPANLWPHKNHRRLLEAFRRFRAQTASDVRLLLTGHPEGWSELRRNCSDLPVEHLGFVPGTELRTLIEGARALTFFSLFEGFGIPLLEAFAAGTPVLCSDSTSLPEVGGDAVLSCDPTDVDAMSRLMERIVVERGLREELVARGYRRLSLYSWERSADAVRAALESAAGPREDGGSAPSVVSAGGDLPLVSIVTPSYNQGRFLRRTIDSVLGQTYPRVEYIVRDGGSTDESLEVLKSYGSRLRWISERDAGQSDAIRKGFAEATGEIEAYLNSDDVLLPDAVERVVDHFRRSPSCDLVYGTAHYIDEQDRITGEYRTAAYSFARQMQDCCICQPATFWRRRIAGLVGPFRADLHYAMDYEYWLRIDRAGGRIDSIADVLACSRLYPETKTLSARAKIYREIFQVCREHGGYVDLNYYYGLWHHRIEEDRRGVYGLFPASGRLSRALARAHHRWDHRPLTASRLAWKWRWTRSARRHLRWVAGFFGDNWIGPELSVRFPAGHGLRDGWLRGFAPVEATVQISSGREPSRTVALPAGQPITLEVPLDGLAGETVTLRFSSHITDAVSRHLSFLLEGTNLFSEHDMISSDRASALQSSWARLVR